MHIGCDRYACLSFQVHSYDPTVLHIYIWVKTLRLNVNDHADHISESWQLANWNIRGFFVSLTKSRMHYSNHLALKTVTFCLSNSAKNGNSFSFSNFWNIQYMNTLISFLSMLKTHRVQSHSIVCWYLSLPSSQ